MVSFVLRCRSYKKLQFRRHKRCGGVEPQLSPCQFRLINTPPLRTHDVNHMLISFVSSCKRQLEIVIIPSQQYGFTIYILYTKLHNNFSVSLTLKRPPPLNYQHITYGQIILFSSCVKYFEHLRIKCLAGQKSPCLHHSSKYLCILQHSTDSSWFILYTSSSLRQLRFDR